MKFTRNRYQEGSLRKVQRRSGAEMWEYRYRNHAEPGSPMRQMTFSVLEYPTAAKHGFACKKKCCALTGRNPSAPMSNQPWELSSRNSKPRSALKKSFKSPPGAEVSPDGMSYSTVAGYSSYLTKHIEPRWSSVFLTDIKPLQVSEWLKKLPLSPKTKGHVRALFHMLFERAMLWGLLDLQRNPIELIKLKGTSRRLGRPHIITP